jgi:excisionase family DNA binding protein
VVADTRCVQATATDRKRLLTTREAGALLSVSIFTVRRLADDGVLPVVRFTPTSRMRFRAEDVEALVEAWRERSE